MEIYIICMKKICFKMHSSILGTSGSGMKAYQFHDRKTLHSIPFGEKDKININTQIPACEKGQRVPLRSWCTVKADLPNPQLTSNTWALSLTMPASIVAFAQRKLQHSRICPAHFAFSENIKDSKICFLVFICLNDMKEELIKNYFLSNSPFKQTPLFSDKGHWEARAPSRAACE